MRPVPVVVLRVDANDALEVAAADDQQPVEAFSPPAGAETPPSSPASRSPQRLSLLHRPARRPDAATAPTAPRGTTSERAPITVESPSGLMPAPARQPGLRRRVRVAP